MILNLGSVSVDQTIYVPFNTFDSSGASVTITGLALADVKIFKDGSVTQRTSTNGITLLDTDGIDFDSMTGIHGISIDLSDDTDSGFYASGSDYWVVIDSITVNSQTVRFVAAVFNIENRAADVVKWNGTAVTDELLDAEDVQLVYKSTISTVNSQTSYDCTENIVLDNNWVGLTCLIRDENTGDKAIRYISAIDETNNTITVHQAPGFTVTAVTPDSVRVYALVHPLYVADVLGVNAVKINSVNVDGTGVSGDLWRGV